VAGTRARQGRSTTLRKTLEIDRLGAHDVDPAVPLGVADAQRDRASHRLAESNAAGDRELVLFEFHPGAAAIAELATGEIGANGVEAHGHAGGQALNNCDQFRAVGFTCGQPTKHA